MTDTRTVQSQNVFKHDPGLGGLVTDSAGNPMPGVRVEIYDSSNKLLGRVSTDEDGYYLFEYKHTGKAATFTVKLPGYGQQKSVTLKANGFVIVNFVVPSS
ncbi:MAG: carboxypeptidase regulatory-like domain-containing protein [Candidatus Rokubacteria bacterium]|nr:carboxypeptidase regulatory-like domain-containing protein [Candidatus Rokubacteria bacterium]